VSDAPLRLLGGGAIDPSLLPADVRAEAAAVELMATLWDPELDDAPPAPAAFSAAWDDA
jgi:hypothetical protein